MALSIDELPNDVESLKALLLAAPAASQAAEAKSASLAAEVERLTVRAERLDHIVSVAVLRLDVLKGQLDLVLANSLRATAELRAAQQRCPVLDPGRGKTKTGYLWAIARDDRSWGGSDPPAVAYTYAPGRSAEHAAALLSGFSGVLQVDGYAGYDRQADGTSHWQGLCRFLDDGRIEIDTNVVDRTIRLIALNRKNALFAGSDEGGANWAIIASLIETCKLNGVNPHAWLTDTLTKLVNRWPASRINELMPWAYAKIGA